MSFCPSCGSSTHENYLRQRADSYWRDSMALDEAEDTAMAIAYRTISAESGTLKSQRAGARTAARARIPTTCTSALTRPHQHNQTHNPRNPTRRTKKWHYP